MKDIFDSYSRARKKEVGCGVIVLIVIIALALVGGWLLFMGWIFQIVWNNALVPTFDLPYLHYWSSVAIVWLIGFVGGCFKKGASSGKNY